MKSLIEKIRRYRKIFIFSIAGGFGAFLGSYLGGFFSSEGTILQTLFNGFVGSSGGVAIWDTFLGLGIGIFLLTSQNVYLRRFTLGKNELKKNCLICLAAGISGGCSLVSIKYLMGNSTLIHCLAWAAEGAAMGFFLAFLIPNLRKMPATVAGFVAGFLGGLIPAIGFFSTKGLFTVAFADSIKGFLLGFLLVTTEIIFQEASLIIHWGPREQSTVSLGTKPILIGNSKECHLCLNKESVSLPVAAAITFVQGVIEIEDKATGQKLALKNGSKIFFGKIEVEVSAKK